MSFKETAITEVIVDGQAAGQALGDLEKQADQLNIKLSQAMRQNDHQEIKKLQKEIKNTDKELRIMKTAVTDVDKVLKDMSGSSLKELQSAQRKLNDEFRKMKPSTAGYSDLQTNLKKLNSEITRVKGETRGLTNIMSSLPGPLGRAATGAMMLGKGFLTLIANPVVLTLTLIAGALYSLGKAFVSTDAGATLLSAQFEKFKSYLSVYYQSILSIGRDGPKFIKHLSDAGRAAREYVYALDALNDAQISFISEERQLEARIASLELIASDQNKTLKQRQTALEEAIELERKLYNKRIEFARTAYQEELKNVAAKYSIDIKLLNRFIQADDDTANKMLLIDSNLARARNAMNDDVQKKLEELYAAEYILIDQRDKGLKRSVARLSGLYKEDTKNFKESIDNQVKLVEMMSKYETDLTNDLLKRIKLADDQEIESEKNKQKIKTSIWDETFKFIEEQEKEDREKLDADIAYELEKEKEDLKNKLAIKEIGIADEFELKRIQLENDMIMELEAAEKSGADINLIKEKYRLLEIENERGKNQTIIELAKQGGEAAVSIMNAFYDRKKQRINQDMQRELSVANLTEAQKEVIRRKYAKKQQELDIRQAIVSGAMATLNGYLTKPFIPAGLVAGTLAAVLAGIQIGTIKKQQFATGRYPIKGPQDGRTYQAAYTGRPVTGIYDKPTVGLFSERMPEMVIDGPTTRSLQINRPDIINSIMAARVNQYASGRFPTPDQGAAGSNIDVSGLIETINRLNSHLDRGIAAKFSYDTVRDIRDRTGDITTIENRTKGG